MVMLFVEMGKTEKVEICGRVVECLLGYIEF